MSLIGFAQTGISGLPALTDDEIPAINENLDLGIVGRAAMPGLAVGADVTPFLKSKLGVGILGERVNKIIRAIKDPEGALRERMNAVINITNDLRAPFITSFNRYLAAGLDQDQAGALARAEAEALFQSKLEGLKVVFPDVINEVALAKSQVGGETRTNILKLLNL
jgi:hypothetical protein